MEEKQNREYSKEHIRQDLDRNYYRSKNRFKNILAVAIVLVILIALFLIKPILTGYLAIDKKYNYTESLNVEIIKNQNFVWIPLHLGSINSIRLSGSLENYTIGSYARIYIKSNNNKYLIFDSERQKGLVSITGFAALNKTNKTQNNNVEAINIISKEKAKKEQNVPPVWKSDIEEFIID